ncbi:MAG: MFS transporter [Pseudomonadota bacterium]
MIRFPSRKVSAATLWAWMFYDWAAQPFFTVVLTFIFGPYFQNFVAPTPEKGQAWWGYAIAVSGALVALTAPMVGAFMDASGRRRFWLIVSMLLITAGLGTTWIAAPGASHLAVLILGGIVIAGLGGEYGILITNAMMPDLVGNDDMGKLSGVGWAVGYLGGLSLLVFVLLAFVFPEQPLFGLDKASHMPDRIVGPLSILWLWLFSAPLLALMPPASGAAKAGPSLKPIFDIIRQWRAHKNVFGYLLARMLYYDGVTAVFLFGGLYAAGTLDWDITQLGIFGIILIITGAIGTFVGGWLDDRLGSKPTIMLSLGGLTLAVLGIVSISKETVLFVLPVAAHMAGDGFGSAPAQAMLVFGMFIGLFLGPVQSASRTLMARISPMDEMNTFFGLYAFTGRATAFLAPLLVALITDISGSRRAGIASIVVLLALGFLLLARVKEARSS